MIRELCYPFDSDLILRKQKSLLRQLENQGDPCIEKRIAVLGGSTTADIIRILNLFLLNEGIRGKFYESGFDRWKEDALFPGEALTALDPEIIFLHTGIRNIREFPVPTDNGNDVRQKAEKVFSEFESVWDALRSRYHCLIIQNNFELPDIRLFGNADGSSIHGKTRFINLLNEKFAEYAESHDDFLIHDVHWLSADYGLERWADPAYWYLYKYSLCPNAIPLFAYSLSRMIKSVCGKNKKFIAADLDNTLWGGIIGDDGLSSIRIGHETAEAEAYSAFQSYLKDLSGLGIPLTVVSKNTEENAESGLSHPDSVLSKADFTLIKANWAPKDRNLAEVAAELNLLPDSAVFIDDNPAEREIVRQAFPNAGVPEPAAPEQYIRAIDRAGYFEVTRFTADDAARNEMYRQNLQREATRQKFTNYEDYLRSLEMTALICPFDELSLPRIAQLVNKTNQFNLTLKRFSQPELEAFARSGSHITLYARLKDKFGDNGIVSALIGEIQGETLNLDLWVMSCRVFERGLERAMMQVLREAAGKTGIGYIRGIYVPGPKNQYVECLYESLGFRKEADNTFLYCISDNCANFRHFIDIREH